MQLSILERARLRQSIQNNLTALQSSASVMERARLRVQIMGDLEKLGLSIGEPEPAAVTSLFDQLLAGQFNGLNMNDFISKLQAAYDEEASLDKSKQASVGYLEANRAALEAA